MTVGFKHKSKFVSIDHVACDRLRIVSGKKYCLNANCCLSEEELEKIFGAGVDRFFYVRRNLCPFVQAETRPDGTFIHRTRGTFCRPYRWTEGQWV